MASKNSIKLYSENSFYHIYNRGVEKRNIFVDDQDYSVFLSYLKTYLTPKDEEGLMAVLSSKSSSYVDKDKAIKMLNLKNYSNSIMLACYALLPNHFHLLIKQGESLINHFMNSVGTRYGMYFNRKYKRTGVLFQDVYKAVLVESDEQLLYLSRYIHLNPLRFMNISFEERNSIICPSSLPEYLGERNTDWIKTSLILEYFSKTNPNNNYSKFLNSPQDQTSISSLFIDVEED